MLPICVLICLKQWFSSGGDFAPQGTFGHIWKDLGYSLSGVLLASSG